MASGEEIRRAREARGLSQAAVAKAIGVSQTAIRKIESGETRKSRFKAEVEQFLGMGGDIKQREMFGAGLVGELRRISSELRRLGESLDRISGSLAQNGGEAPSPKRNGPKT